MKYSVCPGGRVPRRWWASLNVLVTLSAGLLLNSSALAQEREELFGIDGWPIVGLVRLDQATGAILEVHRAETPNGGYSFQSLAFDGGRFLSPLKSVNNLTYTVFLNPSKGFQGTPAMVAGSFANMSVAMDPTTRRIWGVGQDGVQQYTQVWEFDPISGLATSHGIIGGAAIFATGITFDPAGTCYVTDGQEVHVMTLDLNTREATVIGNLHMDFGFFLDIAYSSTGEIWGSFNRTSGVHPTGLYKFDLVTFTPSLIKPLIAPYHGLGFARYPAPIPLCPGKLNSQGCTPRIEVEGFPSATGNLGFYVRAFDVVNQKRGMLLLSVNGSASTPFGGGTLCLASPYYTTLLRTSGGSPTGADCTGFWQLDLEQEIRRREHLGLPPTFSPGQTVYMQWVGRDPALGPPNPISLSSAISVTLMP